MSELINNSIARKTKLKELILKLHAGASEQQVRQELLQTLSSIPYGEVVEVEQELMSEGLPQHEVLRLCDAHSAVLRGAIDLSTSKGIPPGHPVDVMMHENKELLNVAQQLDVLLSGESLTASENIAELILALRSHFNNLYDVDKHYQRKEYLLFPYLENLGITGPPKVMWGKHDEIRDQLKGSIEALQAPGISQEELVALAEVLLRPAIRGVADMTLKEEQILFPMSLDALTEADWYEISRQSLEIGFCLYDPPTTWRPAWAAEGDDMNKSGNTIQLSSGNFTVEELHAILNTLPVDITFVDKNDKVKYFSQNNDRIFRRSRAILNRDVRNCHPPASSHIVDKIIEDFKNGRESRAPFWINLGGKMVHIEYFALRSEKGEYLGTLEVSHDVAPYRKLEGEQRILSYAR
ncbi:MAG: DUF438 domain-containing protein [Ignavibacteriae bacterium]|nr:DUF438 domain-containing protein [Ignavibacteriota bacterium]